MPPFAGPTTDRNVGPTKGTKTGTGTKTKSKDSQRAEYTMLSIPGNPGATCDGISRRELLRVGGAGLLGVSLANLLRFESAARAADHATGAPAPASAGGKQTGFGSAKNFIFIFLQGGPSHLDIWDP